MKTNKIFSKKYTKLKLNSFNMAESEETDLKLQVSLEESDDDSSFEVIEDPNNPRVSTGWTPNDAGFLVASSYPVTLTFHKLTSCLWHPFGGHHHPRIMLYGLGLDTPAQQNPACCKSIASSFLPLQKPLCVHSLISTVLSS